uniref:AAA+ ATPase domain-containing protein n=1 Tax=Chrysotila carterae TaxID=13221 RepID=A0A7S4EX90_CHRCT
MRIPMHSLVSKLELRDVLGGSINRSSSQHAVVAALGDRWLKAHASQLFLGWPRSRSPLADLCAGAQAGAQSMCTAVEEPMPRLNSAASFEDYLDAVRTRRVSPAEMRRAAVGGGRGSRLPMATAHADADARHAAIEAHAAQRAQTAARLRAVTEFSMTPRQVKAHLDKHVISQEEAKRALAVAVCDHYNFVKRCLAEPELDARHHVKPNVLLLGPSGSGKTHLMRALARMLGVPFAKADATKFSATGYVGADVDEVVRSLLGAARGDVAAAEFGIVYVDEVDKLAEGAGSASRGGGVNTRSVQSALLKLMEDAEVPLRAPGERPPWLSRNEGRNEAQVIRTRHVLFIFSGAFSDLEAMLRTEQAQQAAAEHAAARAAATDGREQGDDGLEALSTADALVDPLCRAHPRDFVRAGLETEFIGRIPVRVVCRSLRRHDLVAIMRDAEDSVLKQMQRNFDGYGIDLVVTDEALDEIASRAESERTGARGLLTVLEDTLRDFKFELPSTNLKQLVVDRHTVQAPKKHLEALLTEHSQRQAS